LIFASVFSGETEPGRRHSEILRLRLLIPHSFHSLLRRATKIVRPVTIHAEFRLLPQIFEFLPTTRELSRMVIFRIAIFHAFRSYSAPEASALAGIESGSEC